MQRNQIDQVRRFNRLLTRRVGALQDSYLKRGRPLSQARVIFEAGAAGGIDLRDLRGRLGLDSGHLSRLLRALEADGFVAVARKPDDGRARRVVLTARGREEFAAYDRLSDRLARSMLAPLGAAQRDRLVAAMGEIERLIRAAELTVAIEPADGEAARFCLRQYYAELEQRFETGFFAGPDDAAELAPPSGAFVVARIGGEPVGCGGLRRLAAATGEIKRVWTAPSMRGLGVASAILAKLEAIARDQGHARLRLDTNRTLTEAHALYAGRGYREIARYNDNPYAHHWFEKRL